MLRFITLREIRLPVTKRVVVFSLLTALLTFGTTTPIWASVNFAADIPIAGNPITTTYDFEKSFFIKYPSGSDLANILQNKQVSITFTDNSDDNPDIKSFMQTINTDFATNRHSTAIITNLVVNYQLTVTGSPDQASFDYKVVLTPTVTGYILNKGGGDTPTVMDAEWIAWADTNPVSLLTEKYGPLEINYPIDAIKSQIPDVYNALKGTEVESVMSVPLLDATGLLSKQPLDKWDSLFDPAYTLAESSGFGYKGQKLAVTTFSSGLSGAMAGQLKVNNVNEDFTVGGTTYHISTVERPDSGTINAEGHANPYQVQGAWAISTSAQAAQGVSNATAGGMSTITIYTMAGVASAIAAGIFIWSNKKMKQVTHHIDTGPIQYETRQHWADRFDTEPTGAATTGSQPSGPDDKSKRTAI